MKNQSQALKTLLLTVGLLLSVLSANAQVRYSVATGNWNSTATWSATSGGASGASVPIVTDNVVIEGGYTVTVNAISTCANLSIANGSTLVVGGFDFTVNGATTVDGTINHTSITGTKIFTGIVTINASGVWNNNTVNESITIRGGITNNGTFNAGTGNYTFDTNPQTLTGTLSIPTITVTGITLTNNGTITVGTALSGTGGLTQAVNSTLNIGGGSAITTLTAANNGNTVNFAAVGAQPIKTIPYFNLTISGGGNKTMAANVSVAGTLNLAAGTFTVGANTLSLNGPTIAGTPSNLVTGATSNLVFGGTSAGVFIPSSVVSLSGLSITNTSIVTLQSSLVLSGLFNPAGAGLSIGANTLTLNGIINCGTLAGGATSNITIGGAGAASLPAVTLNNLIVNRAIALCGNVTVGGTLTLTAGALSIAANTITLSDGANLSYGAGTLTGGATSNLTIGTGADISLNAITNGLNNFNTSRNIILGAALTVNGTLTLTAGTFTVGANTLTLNGPTIAGIPTSLSTIASSNLLYGGSSAGVVIPSSVTALNNLTINNTNGITLNSSPALSGALTLTSGALNLNGNALTISASGSCICGGTGVINGNIGSSFVINGAAATNLPPGTYQNLIINRSGGVTLCGSIIINGTLTLTSGIFSIAANTLTLSDDATLSYGGGTLTGGATSNITIGTGADITLNAITNGLNNFNTSRNIILLAALTVNGTLTLTAGSFTVGANTLTLNGPTIAGTPSNLVTTAASSLTFGGTSAGVLIPTSIIALNNLSISNTSTVNLQSSLTVSGTFTPAGGGLSIGPNTLTLNGPIVCGPLLGGATSNIIIGNAGGATNLPGVTLNNLTINRNITMCGNVTVGGTLTLTAGALSISANTLTLPDGANLSYGGGTLTGGVTSNFTIGTGANITLNAIAGGLNNFNTSRNITLGAGLSVNGTLTLTAGTFTVGANTLTLNGPTIAGTPANLIATATSSLVFGGNSAGVSIPSIVTNLNNLTINNTSGVTMNSNISLAAAGVLTLTSGMIQAGTYILKINNTNPAAIVWSLGSFVNITTGSVERTLLPNLAGTANNYLFPIGEGGVFKGINLREVNTGATGPVLRASVSPTGALTSDGITMGTVNPRCWSLINLNSGNLTSAKVELYESGLEFSKTIGMSAAVGGNYTAIGGSSNTPSIISPIITNPGPYFCIGAIITNTYYSYQTGDWSNPTTWTSDPSGTLQIGTTIPADYNKVIILSGRTVSLSADIITKNLDITIEAGGFIDQNIYRFTNGIYALRGQGTIKLASLNFPATVVNTFIASGGGTAEYFNSANFTLPAAQTTYNNLTINTSGFIATQLSNITLNGNLYVKSGNYRINDNASAAKLTITINGNVTVDNGGSLTVGNGATNPLIGGVTSGGVAPFINYYTYFHTVIIKGDFTNNGTVKFTNLPYPIYNAFPPNVSGPTAGAASVYFQGTSNNTLTCNGVTDFYNLILDKGTDQTYKLTISSTGYNKFRIFGANTLAGEAAGSNANLRKALWIRTGTIVLEGSLIIPSLSEGAVAGPPTSDFYIPSNGALILNGVDVNILSTADDYREVNTAYSVAAPNDGAIGISKGGNSALYIFGKLQINNGYLSTRESGGLITSLTASGQLIINGGTVDAKQFLSPTGSAQYTQTGGTFILRGRFQRTPSSYATVADITDFSAASLNASRAANGTSSGFGSFNLEQPTNIFTVSGGTIRIYDVCGVGVGEEEAFDVKSSGSNINVTGGTLEIVPTAGSVLADAINYSIYSTASLNNFIINRASSTSTVRLSTPLIVLNDLSINSGDFNANNFNVSVGRNFTIANGTSYTPGTNTTILNGTANQLFTVNLAGPLSLNKFTIDKPSGVILEFAGTQKIINVVDNFRLVLGTLKDNGNTINVGKDIYNSGLQTGTGKIVLNSSTVSQVIDGNGIFENIELNNTSGASAPVSLAANMTINGALTLSQDNLFNIGTNNLKLNSAASIINAGATRYIQTAGNAGDGGLTKVYATPAAFQFPVGAPTIIPVRAVKYTPAAIGFSTAPSTYGFITVVPVGYEHPATTVNGQSLTYFWRIKSSGFSGIAPNSVTHSFVYNQSDVVGVEANYVPALYTNSDFKWRAGTNSNPPIDISGNLISDWTNPTNSTDYLEADYTAGDASFGTPLIYYSRQSGLWGTTATWSLTGHTVDNPPALPPGLNDIVIIGGQDSVYLATNNTIANTDVRSCASLQIEKGSALDIGYNFNCNFGIVQNHSNGNGNFRLTTSWNSGSTFTFPLGDFSDFNVNLGTTELYSTNPGSNTTYWLPNGVFTYGNLIISPLGGSNIIFPNNDLTIYGNLITRGQNADSWFCPTWNVPYPTTPAAVVAKTITVNGDLNIQGGALVWYGNGPIAQNIVVNRDVIVAPLSAIFNRGGATNQRLSIGRNLVNNANGVANAPAGTVAQCQFTSIPVTFYGSTSATISNTIGFPLTIFGQVTINKGTSQSTTLTCNIGGTLTTLIDNWLTMQNGTFRFMRTDPTSDFTISTTTPFTIPETAGMTVDYANANNMNILIGNSVNNNGDLLLSGKLTLISGNIYIGQIASPANNNDIEYSGSGSSAIEIQSGNLIVNGQIRRNTSTTNGILNYTQSGGTVSINGNAANAGYAKLEVLNTGSVFNMSGGTLSIIRGGGTTYGDLYLRPASSSVTGGTIIFTNVIPNNLQNYLIDANIPLNNLTVTGPAGAGLNASLGLIVSPLVLNGTLTLSNSQSIFNSNNINVSLKGNLNNNGTYNFGTNTTTFNGGVQLITGTSVTNFYNLNVSSANSLTLNKNLSVNLALFIGSGTLVLGNNKLILSGNLVNNGSYTDDNTTGGISLSGTIQQLISGTGAYGKLEINNSSGAKLNNGIMLQNDLVLTQGIFNINSNLLTLSQNSNILGTPGIDRMIMSDGVTSSLGVRKFFTAAPQNFTFPVGVAGKYTPANFNITASSSVGYINVNPINNYHPNVIDPLNVLKYYWQIESSGISGFTADVLLQYVPGDVNGVESDYVAARLELPGSTWFEAPPGPATDNVDETNHRITFKFSTINNLSGEYTAGKDIAIPGEVPTYQTNKDGTWSDQTIWTSVGSSPPCPAGGPKGSNVIIDHIVTINTNNIYAYKTTINNRLRVVSPTFGHNLGVVDGNGTIYLESGSLPSGNYTSFIDCSGNSTIEYGGTGTYTIIATQLNSLPNMFITGTGRRILPVKDLTICKRLVIDGPALDNSVNNKKLIILGSMERYNTGSFISGTGNAPNASVSFAGTSVQTIGGPTGDFSGANKFNNLEINNPAGVIVGAGGQIEINNNLLLTYGIVTTTSSNKLIIDNTSSASVVPTGGSSSSFVSGPLIKQIINGGSFLFPLGKGTIKGHDFTLTSAAGSTIFWTAEYFTPNSTATSLTFPLIVSNTMEFWGVSAPIATIAKIKIGWNPQSDLTPLMTVNGMSDMRVAEYNSGSWNELASTASGNVNTGDVESTNNVNVSSTPKNYTTASISLTIARAALTPGGPVCGTAGIPVTFTSFNPITLNYTLNYTINGVPQTAVIVSSLPYTLPTPVPGAYRLTGFTYNNSVIVGVVDGSVVNVYASPTSADAGPDQSLCGLSGTTLAGNTPVPYTGLWTIVSGAGGTFVNSTLNNTVFIGVLGVIYTLRWTITNVSCISSDDVVISFPFVAAKPSGFSSAPTPVCQGSSGNVYTVINVPGNTYTWTYSGTGSTITGSGNSVTINFSPTATSGTLSVTATNSCGTSAPRTVNITVTPTPVATFSYTGNPYCPFAVNPSPVFSGGGVAGTFSSTAGLVFVSTATGQVNLAASTPGIYTVTNTIAASGGCSIVTATSPITIISDLVWTGAVSTDWNDAGNWSCGYVPALITPVQIPNTPNKPMLSGGATGTVNNLMIDIGSSLTVNGNKIQISGTITNNGTFTAVAGTVEFNGTVAQLIGNNVFSGNTINNLTINNTAGVTLQGPLNITGIVWVQNGNFSSGGNLTLLSTAAQTALIDGSGTGSVTGNVIMQRYLPSGFGYKYFSSPFQAATVNEFGDDMDLGSAFTSFYKYDENKTSSGWVSYKTTTNILDPLAGYAVNFGSASAANTVDVTGVVNNGGLSVTIYNHNQPYTKGFNLVGNPYPSPIDWKAASGWTKTNIDDALYYFKAGTTDQYGGTYISYVNGVSTGGLFLNLIPSMQGFFVHVTNGTFPVTGTLALNNNVRITDLTHSFTKSEGKDAISLLRLIAGYSDDTASYDPLVIYDDIKATSGFDGQLDALKLFNTDNSVTNFYAFGNDGARLSINALPMTDSLYTIPLGLKTAKNGEVVFRIKDIGGLFSGKTIYISDVIAGLNQNLLDGNEYKVSLAAGDYQNRFFLNLSSISTDVPDLTPGTNWFTIYSSNGILKAEINILQGDNGTLTICNLIGQTVFIARIYAMGHYEFTPAIKDGIYIVSFITGNKRISKKIFIQGQ